ncbi:transcriptional antiterminator, BglG family [Paenibacillus sp. UNCCL117]|uniref:glucose PTS transporter transcription antiterminator GlcT n=1 Tax=unclassified Paenibacillus TaxID=185978 RepID=UPI000886FED5|nr:MULTISPECIES: PRD domain-containing protein [unclassified Paenibacillus]SDC04844.1 transcriptional antiterminator, BglG family [Paenibacillus sp. cl123]SFW37429.1 transcriptional antiterminator, BglG family [Paenibacillus sp. UNCCL117]
MQPNGLLRIERVISNNVIMVVDPDSGKEYVLLGKGIGFSSKSSGTIQAKDPRIEKRFRLDDRDQLSEYQTLLEGIDPEVIRISEQIIEQVTDSFSLQPNSKVYFALPSHIQFAVYRLRNGMDITNPFLQETQLCFPKEYEIAKQAAAIISHTFHIEVPEDEIGFLAFHVHSAVTDVSVGELVKFSNLINESVDLIEERLSIKIPRESMDYVRLITHLRFTVERISQNKVVANPFMQEFQTRYRREYQIASDIGKLMTERLHTEVPEDEIGYLVMHLYRLFQAYMPHRS